MVSIEAWSVDQILSGVQRIKQSRDYLEQKSQEQDQEISRLSNKLWRWRVACAVLAFWAIMVTAWWLS